MTGQRIVVVGTSGSGKTTLARQLAAIYQIPHIELDNLHWQPNWQEASVQQFRQEVSDAILAESWTVDGNYSKVRDLVWARADTLIWLDYPLYLSLWRLWWRSIRRIVTREKLWEAGNRESFRNLFLSRDSLFIWAITSQRRRKRLYSQLLAQPEYAHLHVLRFYSPNETDEWLVDIRKNYAPVS